MLAMGEKPFGLLELGSNSLKFYLVEVAPGGGHTIKTHKFPWRIAHDFFSTGRIGDATVLEMLAAIRGVEKISEGVPLSSMLAVATGVFRELPDILTLAARVKAEAGIRLRVITGEDEARLMAKGFPAQKHKGSVLLCDLGGATTEWAWIQDGTARGWGSLPLGAIRCEYRFRKLKADAASYLRESRKHCDTALERLKVAPATAVMATGGTARAASAVVGRTSIPIEDLRQLAERVLSNGPPADLRPERQAVLLPGLIILERICTRCGAVALDYAQTSVRDGMAERLIHLLGSYRRQDLHSTLLLHTRSL